VVKIIHFPASPTKLVLRSLGCGVVLSVFFLCIAGCRPVKSTTWQFVGAGHPSIQDGPYGMKQICQLISYQNKGDQRGGDKIETCISCSSLEKMQRSSAFSKGEKVCDAINTCPAKIMALYREAEKSKQTHKM
jgi:hypothetical protein